MRTAVKSQKRVHKFTVLLTREERESLARMAVDSGLCAGDVVRQFIRGKIQQRAA